MLRLLVGLSLLLLVHAAQRPCDYLQNSHLYESCEDLPYLNRHLSSLIGSFNPPEDLSTALVAFKEHGATNEEINLMHDNLVIIKHKYGFLSPKAKAIVKAYVAKMKAKSKAVDEDYYKKSRAHADQFVEATQNEQDQYYRFLTRFGIESYYMKFLDFTKM